MATILITGANRGIGLELTRQYAAAGHHVHACCRNPATASDLAALGSGVTVHGVHVVDGASVAALAARLAGQPLDILINNAGATGPSGEHQSLTSMDFDGWEEAFRVNTMAPLRVLQALLPNLQAGRQAKAITITSQMGALSLNWPTMYAYCSSKAAVNKVMRMASAELAKQGIAVGLLHPGWVQTDMGGAGADITAADSAAGIIRTIESITVDNTGCFLKWNGDVHGW